MKEPPYWVFKGQRKAGAQEPAGTLQIAPANPPGRESPINQGT